MARGDAGGRDGYKDDGYWGYDISGQDVLDCGVPPGRAVGLALRSVAALPRIVDDGDEDLYSREAVLDGLRSMVDNAEDYARMPGLDGDLARTMLQNRAQR